MSAWRRWMDSDAVAARYRAAALAALAAFPIEPARVVPVSVSENITFRVTTADGDWSLRLHRPDYNSIEELNSERAWTRALQQSGIAVPDALEANDGAHYVRVDIPGTTEWRYAGLTAWTHGAVLRDRLDDITAPAERQQIFWQIGALAARLHNQAVAWRPPPGFTRRRLGLEALLGESPAWGRFWAHSSLTETERQLLLDTRQALREGLDRYGQAQQRFGLIHADLDPGNLILTDSGLALIDFDDAAFGWHGYDLASPLDEVLFAPDLDDLRAALVDGYWQHRPLAQADIDWLPRFLLIRGMALIGWYHQRPEHAGSDYFEEVKAWVLERCAA